MRVDSTPWPPSPADPHDGKQRGHNGDQPPSHRFHAIALRQVFPVPGPMLRQPDPLFGTVGKALMLPDRDLGFEIVDQASRGRKGLVAVRGSSCHHNGEVADLEGAGAVVGGEPHTWVGVSHPTHHALELVQCAGMCGVFKGQHRLLGSNCPIVIAHGPDEDDDATRPSMRHGCEGGVDRKRGLQDGNGRLHGVEPTGRRARYAGSDLGTPQTAVAVTVTW